MPPYRNVPCAPAGLTHHAARKTSTQSANGIVGLCSSTVTPIALFPTLKTTLPSSFRKSAVTDSTRMEQHSDLRHVADMQFYKIKTTIYIFIFSSTFLKNAYPHDVFIIY